MTTISTSVCNLTQQVTLQEETSAPVEIEYYLEKLNYKTFIQLIPLVVFLIALIAVGVCGNLLVFLVYFKQFKASATRVFVLAMAVCDFLTNVFALTWLMQDMRYSYISVDYFCKLKRLLGTFPIIMSFLILVCVALDRRRRICQVHKRQLSARQATYLLIFPFIFTSGIVFPFAFLYGAKPLETDLPGITGTTCGFPETQFGRKVKQAYGVVMGISYGVGFALLTSSYMQISNRIYHQKKKNDPVEQFNFTATYHVNRNKKKGYAESTNEVQIEISKNTVAEDFGTTNDLPELSSQKERSRFEMRTRDFVELQVIVDTCSSRCSPQDMFAEEKSSLEDNCHDEYGAQDVYRRPGISISSPEPKMEGQQRSIDSTSKTTIPECSIKKSVTTSNIVFDSEALSGSAKTSSDISVLERCAALSAKSTVPACVETTQRLQDLRSQNARQNQRKKALISKTTLMMFALSVATLVFYVPYIAVMLAESKYMNIHISVQRLNLHFLSRCFPIINSVINPFIYSFCNPKFRQECRRFLTKSRNTLYPQM